jgi:hypothetical protein
MSGIPRKKPKAPTEFQVRVGEDELGRIFHLRDSIDQIDTLVQHAERYRGMNWVLETRGEGVSALDFSQSSEVWGERLMTLALGGVKVDLLIKTGLPSRLLVIETPRGETLVDTYGEWRSACRAVAGEDREQHYFALPPASRVPVSGKLDEFRIQIYGQDGLVLAPPSRHGEDGPSWSWLAPPWELPPDTPGPPLWEFLEDFGLLQEVEGDVGAVLPWDQVYALISPHEGLIRTLLTPSVSAAAYYRELAQQAWHAGIKDKEVLFALLWHAPQGDARTSPERLTLIRDLSAAAPRDEDVGKMTPKLGSPAPALPQEQPQRAPDPVAEFQPSANGLVDFMENRVVLDRSRYEAMIFELAELTAKAEALQRRLEEFERQTTLREMQVEDLKAAQMFQTPPPQNQEFPFDSMVGMPPSGHHKPLSSLKTVVQEFLKNNTDLAANSDSVRMLQFCLRNYIDLNPELNALPLGEKLEMAGKMAREFMTQVSQRSS